MSAPPQHMYHVYNPHVASGAAQSRAAITAREFARAGGADLPKDLERAEASGVAFDSRTVLPGQCFIALRGANTHGHVFIDDAIAHGAAFAVSDLPHPRALRVADPRAALTLLARDRRDKLTASVIAVTGSAGKTTTKELLALALGSAGITCRTTGNLNTDLGLAKALLECDPGARYLVAEAGIDRPGEMADHVKLLRPDVGVLTLIAAAHTEFLGDLAGVAREKRALLENSSQAFASSRTRPWLGDLKVSYYGFDETATVRGEIIGGSPSTLTIKAFGVPCTVHSLSRVIAENALGALTVAVALGANPAAAAGAIACFRPLAGRMRILRAGERVIIDDAYNSNPASLTAALEVLRAHPRPRVAILGEMLELGAQTPAWHRQAGSQASLAQVDFLVAIGPSAGEVIDGALADGYQGRYWSFPKSLEGIAAIPELPPRATILVKGSRGMKLDTLVDHLLNAFPGSPKGGPDG